MSANTREKVVVFTGAGMSADSGLATFRDARGLWRQHRPEQLATPEAFAADPQLVLDFYNERRRLAWAAQPNAAHRAVAELQARFEVVVITQNVDDLHERAGSKRVLHLHGALRYARSTRDPELIYDKRGDPIAVGDLCELGSQLRPHVVWFGEAVPAMDTAIGELADASRVLVIGTSLSVYPAAGVVHYAPATADKIVVAPELDAPPEDFTWVRGTAASEAPAIVARWLNI